MTNFQNIKLLSSAKIPEGKKAFGRIDSTLLKETIKTLIDKINSPFPPNYIYASFLILLLPLLVLQLRMNWHVRLP